MGKQSEYYNIYYLNRLNKYSINYFTSPIKVLLPIEDEIIIKIKQEDNDYKRIIGQNSTISFITDFEDKTNLFNATEIEEKSSVEATITDNLNNEYHVICRLWKPIDEKLRLFCTFEENLDVEVKTIKLNNITFIYNEQYNISIINEAEEIEVNRTNGVVPFLYSEKQLLNVTEYQDLYYLRFKFDSYNNEFLIFFDKNFNELILDDCEKVGNELIFTINKSDIEKILVYDEETFSLLILNDEYGIICFDSVLEMKISYKNVYKEDIDIDIAKLKEKVYDKDSYVSYETWDSVSSAEEVISDIFYLNFSDYNSYPCFLKKSKYENFLLLCKLDNEGTYSLEDTLGPIELNNISIKYNFKIHRIYYYESVNITNYFGNNILDRYPNILNFTNKDIIEITLINNGNNNQNENIKLNPIAEDYLECQYYTDFTKCVVPLSHFDFEINGYFNTYHTNSKGDLSIYYELSPFEVILPERKVIKMLIKKEDNIDSELVGSNGILYFITNYIDEEEIFDPSDIEEKTFFKATIKNNQDRDYDANCRLWVPIGKKIIVICKLNEIPEQFYETRLNSAKLTYNDYNISIVSETDIYVNKRNFDISFIYSDKQDIYINDSTNIYELKFKYESYNNDILYLYGIENYYDVLDNCKSDEKELICKITKEKLLTMLINDNETLKLGGMNDNLGIMPFNLVYGININYTSGEKEDISVNITTLLENVTGLFGTFAYDTDINIKSITNLNTLKFSFAFNDGEVNLNCNFKKSEMSNLLLLCVIPHESFYKEYYLGKIKEEIILNTIHYKFNFIIQPVENYEKIYISDYDTQVELVYPETLNFTEETIITLRYIMDYPYYSKNIKLNPDSDSELKCDDLSRMKKCVVTMNHFKNKESGYYYTHHSNNLGGSSIYYDVNPINVIVTPYENIIEIIIDQQNNYETIIIGQKGTLYFKTSYNDTENIFNISYLDESPTFNTTITVDNYEKYNVICRLWKPKDDNLTMLCDLNETLGLGNHQMSNYKYK